MGPAKIKAVDTVRIGILCFFILCTVKKRLAIFLLPAGMSLTKLSLAGKNLLFPTRESLVGDISAGDRKIANLFLTVWGDDGLCRLTIILLCTQ